MPGSALRGASLPSAASTRLGLPCLQPPLYGPIDELPCPLVGCLGSRFDLLDDVGLIPLEIPNTAAAGAAYCVFWRRVVVQRGWSPRCAKHIRPWNSCRFESKDWSVALGRQWQLLARASRGRKSSGSSSGVADSEQTINRDCQMVEENKTVVATWLREFWGSSWNPRIINELAAADINLHHQLHEPRRGRASVTRFMTDFREAFPDLCFQEAGDLIAEGNYVVARWEGSGTHTGSAFSDFRMGSLPAASGRKMKFTGTSVFRIDQGRIAEDIGREDALTAMFQLGLIRLPDPQAEALTAMFQAGLIRAPEPAAPLNTPGSSLPPGWNNMGGFPGEKLKSN
jgi:predicted ester cyclase